MTLAASITNKTDCEALTVHKQFGAQVRLTDATGGEEFELVVQHASATNPTVDGDSTIISSTHGSVTNGTISDITIPTDTKQLDMGVIIDQRAQLQGYFDDLIYTFTPSLAEAPGTPGTIEITECDSWDSSIGYNKDEETFGPGILYVDGKVAGLIEEISFSRLLEIAAIMSGSVYGQTGQAITKDGFEVKCGFKQLTLQQLKWQWVLRNDVERDENIHVLGGTYAGDVLTLESAGFGYMPEHNIILKIPNRKDSKILVVELYYASVKSPTDWAIKKDAPVITNVTFGANVTADPENQVYGIIYLLDKAS